MDWIYQYSGKKFKITIQKNYSSRTTARVKTYGDVVADYEHHPESKCADDCGNVCDRQTQGLLYRRHVRIGEIIPIGKESNNLEEVDTGMVHSAESVYTTYPDRKRDAWAKAWPRLKAFTIAQVIDVTGLSRRMVIKARNWQVRPHPRNQQLLTDALRKLG
jgi:hypothetical protein